MNALALPDAHLLAKLPDGARAELKLWSKKLASVRPPVVRAFRRIAAEMDVSWVTVKRRYHAARKGNWMAILDKRATPELWQRPPEKLPEVTVEFFRGLCEKNQRCSSEPIRVLRRMWLKKEAIPGFDGHPGWPAFPRGFSPRNLYNYLPTKYQLTASRVGRTAAAAHRPLVYTTRKGLWVASHYMFDDLWHDFFVNSFAEKQAGRPLELLSHDLFTARKVRWGIRVRTRKGDGSYNQLEERMTRYILAATLHLDGYSPRGTVLVAEHGTAAIREEIEEELLRISKGLITVSRSGMTGAAAHAGMYPGIARGNPRHKASLESHNNLYHNALADLPAQTGKDVEHRPEGLSALLQHNEALLAARSMLPAERAALLSHPMLEVNQFIQLATERYREIERSHEHELEGWIESGLVTNEVQIADQWVSMESLMALDDAKREAVTVLIEKGALPVRTRKASRWEAWQRGSRELIRLPGYGVCAILGNDLAQPRPVQDGCFEFEDAEIKPGTLRFSRFVRDAEGREIELKEDTYETFINPFAPQSLFVRDVKGRYLGEAREIHEPCRADAEAVQRQMGRAAKEESAALVPFRARHQAEAREKLARHRHNAAVARGEPVTPAEKARARDERRRVASHGADALEEILSTGGAGAPNAEQETEDDIL